ncbi:MAG: tetratricopeptide repeat protein [Saprospiraceae bacterium]
MANAYVFQFYEEYQLIAWITQNAEDIADDFVQNKGLIRSLEIDTEGKEADAVFLEVLLRLHQQKGHPKLFIIDNATQAIEQYLDKLPAQPEWHLLVTSRERIHGLHPMSLDFLSPEEAILLFKKHCTTIKEEALIKEVVETVDYHTLTIEILAKTAEKQRTDIQDLKRALEQDLRANVKTRHSKNNIEKITSYLSTIFTISGLDEKEIGLMKQFASLPPVFHSYELLDELIDPQASESADFFSETLANLVEKGWLIKEEATDNYKMHRIIIDITQTKAAIEPDDIAPLIEQVTSKLSMDYTKDNPIDKFQWIPYGNAILKALPTSDAAPIANLQNNLALVLKDLGDYQGAKTLLEKAMQSDEHNFGKDHPTTAVRYSNLALVLQDLGDYQGAKTLLEKAMQSDEHNFGKDHPTTAVRYSNLALVLQDLGDYQGAKTLLEKAMQSAEHNFGKDHPTTAVRYSNLALVLQDLGDYQGAKTLLEKAMQSDEHHFGKDHPNTAGSYSIWQPCFMPLEIIRAPKPSWKKRCTPMSTTLEKTIPIRLEGIPIWQPCLKPLGIIRAPKPSWKKPCSPMSTTLEKTIPPPP